MKHNIQHALLPGKNPMRYSGMEIAFHWQPYEDVGGDYFYCNKIDHYVYIEIGDVMGHGIEAALAMTALHGVMYGLRQSALPLPQIVTSANRFLTKLRRFQNVMTCSIFVGRIDVRTGTLEYINAGHPPPLYLARNREAGTILPLRTGGLLLGFQELAPYEVGTLRPQAGDILLLYTDGLSECPGQDDESFGLNRLEILLSEKDDGSADRINKRVLAQLEQFRHPKQLHDDLALAVVRFTERFTSKELL